MSNRDIVLVASSEKNAAEDIQAGEAADIFLLAIILSLVRILTGGAMIRGCGRKNLLVLILGDLGSSLRRCRDLIPTL